MMVPKGVLVSAKRLKLQIENQNVSIAGGDYKTYAIPKQILKAYIEGKIEINWEKWTQPLSC